MTSALALAAFTGAALALLSSAHCALMCGPLALAARVRGGTGAVLSYLAGRLISYALLGGLAGSVGKALLATAWARWTEALLSWLLAAILLHTGIRALRAGSSTRLIQLGKAPRVERLGRALARVADEPLLLGAATALLPCGALFAALTTAAALGTAAQGALAMAAFSAVTGAGVAGVAQFGALDRRGPAFKRALGGALLLGAGILLYRPVPLLSAGDDVPSCHGPSASREESR